jgi:hypothetical protein
MSQVQVPETPDAAPRQQHPAYLAQAEAAKRLEKLMTLPPIALMVA